MIDVYFIGENSRSLGRAMTYDLAYKILHDFVRNAEKNNGFKWHYTRIIQHKDLRVLEFDVGSHVEFIEFRFDTQQEYDKAVEYLAEEQKKEIAKREQKLKEKIAEMNSEENKEKRLKEREQNGSDQT